MVDPSAGQRCSGGRETLREPYEPGLPGLPEQPDSCAAQQGEPIHLRDLPATRQAAPKPAEWQAWAIRPAIKKPARGPVKAEREGFEPSIELPLYSISSAAPSTTRPPLQRQMGQVSM